MKPPVLLLGGLNVVRALGLARVPVIVASPERAPHAAASRYCAGRCALPPLARREAVAEALARAGKRLSEELGARLPLFYSNDEYLDLVRDFHAELSPYFLLALNDPALARALADKSLFQALGEAHGLPVPRRLSWETLESAQGPVLVKPKLKQDTFVHARVFRNGKALAFESGAAALAHPDLGALADKLSFQEYIPGDDSALWSCHGFATEKGELLAGFIGRKIRTYPGLTGYSSYLELAHDEGLEALGREVAGRLALKGVFKLDFKRDARTGRFHLLEVNARFNLWHYLGARNGVNLPKIAYDYLVSGARPAPQATRYVERYRWLCLGLDRRAFRELASRGELSAGRWLASLAAAPKIYDLFAWSDPLPFLLYWATRIRSGLARRMHRWLATAS